jgi:hypothetical protein
MKQWSELQFSVYLSFPPPHKKCIRQDSGLNGSKHPPYLICSYFTVMCKFGSLVSFPNELCLTLEWSNTRPVYTALTSSLLDFFNCIAVCKVTGNVTWNAYLIVVKHFYCSCVVVWCILLEVHWNVIVACSMQCMCGAVM